MNILDDMIKTPQDEPWWGDSIELKIDATNDGFFYGSDNYRILATPKEMSGGNVTVKAFVVTNGEEDDEILPAPYRGATVYSKRFVLCHVRHILIIRYFPIGMFASLSRDGPKTGKGILCIIFFWQEQQRLHHRL